ncbi:exported hypothetical protein [Desulfamplus magnetovallimortis]|uniref:DUF4412 domain-containing protein n=1 Tax=Desulfamplus magnetovallimortis TaxID=1246637 RepID=A0A1W1H7Q9_9BACT|nr:hypothetical protein [Desulfamplus magnetovallimortis]SLM28499.1 exported hypothetical protein [Desulfamplus magnetovallimortis]
MKKLFLTAISMFLMTTANISAQEFSADMETNSSLMQETGKIYHKNSDISRTEMMGIITIMKRPKIYQIFDDTKKYYISDINEVKKNNPIANMDITDFKTWATHNNMKKIGNEKIEDFSCDIFEGNVKFEESQPPVHMKVWYSDKLNYALKTVMVLPDPAGTISNLAKNIKTGKQPDSLFELPAGYTMAKSMEEAMGIPDMSSLMQGAPAGIMETGNMPSMDDINSMQKKGGQSIPTPEEREKMIKKMQEMMKQMQQQQQQ